MYSAGFGRRFAAKFIDFLIVLPLILINTLLFQKTNHSLLLIFSLGISFMTLLYNIFFIYRFGKTLGKMALKIKVLQTSGKPVTLKNAVFREVFYVLSLALGVISSYLTLGFLDIIDFALSIFIVLESLLYFLNDKGKTLHDYIGDTIVVKE